MIGLLGNGPNRDLIDLERAGRADPALLARVLRYDQNLIVYYDKGVSRWGVARKMRNGEIVMISLLQGPKGEYVPFDSSIMDTIRSWDWRPDTLGAPRNADEYCRSREQAQLERDLKAERDFDDDISHLTRSNTRSLRRALGQLI